MDIWKVGVVNAPMAEVLQSGLANHSIRWIEAKGSYRFLADPFGLMQGDELFVFAEAYDYRSRLGMIEVLRVGGELQLLERKTSLTEAWHLSYPIVIEEGGEFWMLPEASRSGRLTLYRSIAFPDSWEPFAVLDLPHVAVDATPFRHDGVWWLIYAAKDDGALHLCIAESLAGPWRPHPDSPLTRHPQGARPGGTPISIDGRICAPVQDCSRTYGGAIRPLWFDELTPDRAITRLGGPVLAPASAGSHRDGLHTLSACGRYTLIDVKRVERSWARVPIDLLGRCRRAVRGWHLPQS